MSSFRTAEHWLAAPAGEEPSARSFDDLPRVMLGGLPIAVTSRAESADLMIALALARRGSRKPPLYVTSANGQVLSACARDPAVRRLFLEADLIHADGMPMVMASRFLASQALPERVATTDLFHEVAAVAQSRGASFYLLGATPEALGSATGNIRRLYPDLKLVGVRHGYFEHGEEEGVRAITDLAPDVLWIGMGVPREQQFVLRWREALAGVGVIKTSGGLFDHLSGFVPRAPGWIQAAGFEWLFRLAVEPRRLFLRYAATNPHALYLLLTRSH